MGKASILVAALMLAAAPSYADRVVASAVDTTGWTLLGEQTVQGKRDRDTIVVGKYEGRFDQIQLVVLDSDIELGDVTFSFANGEKWSPKLRHSFREGQRSRIVDLPGENRTIKTIELTYANTPGGGRAKVAIYGRDSKENNKPARPDPRPMAPAFDPKGWTMLGEQTVDGRRDRDTIKVSKYADKVDQLILVVSESDLELNDVVLKFGNKQVWSPHIKHVFKEGQRSRVIDLPGENRNIKTIDLSYANLPGGGRAKIAVYGRNVGRQPVEIKPVVWEHKGWTSLGTATVDGWRDSDRIYVKDKNWYTEVMLVVAGSDIELRNVVFTFAKGEKFQLPANVVFKEGTRTSAIDLPGGKRFFKTIDFSYGNLPGGGRATVEVWGRQKETAPTKAPPTNAPNGNTGVVPPTLPSNPPPPPPPPVVRDHR